MDLKQAIKIQEKIRKQVVLRPLKRKIRIVAGFDLSYLSEKEAIAGAVLFKWPSMKEIGRFYCKAPIRFPYISGFLSFREMPALLKLWKKLKQKPDLLFIDGQGIAHPRGVGIASHLGITLKKPAIGIAKSRLVGEYKEPAKKKGSKTFLKYKNKKVGMVIRMRNNVKPVFVSPGHLVNIDDSAKWALRVTGEYRIPEPTRLADLYVNKLKRSVSRG